MSGKRDVKFVVGDEDVILEEGEYRGDSQRSPGMSVGVSPGAPSSTSTPVAKGPTMPISITGTLTRNVQIQQGTELAMSPRTMLRYVYF